MSDFHSQPRPEPVLPEARRVGAPVWFHLLLFVVTFMTLAAAGGAWWEGKLGDLSRVFTPEGFWFSFRHGWSYALWVSVIVGSHEMGHYLACRYYRIPATLPYFLPAPPILIGSFGAVIRIRGRIPHRRALFDVAAAGPIAGFVPLLPVLIYSLVQAESGSLPPAGAEGYLMGKPLIRDWLDLLLGHGERMIRLNGLYGAAWVGMLVTSLNLFPVGQLDGGHAVYALSPRLHRLLSWGTIVALAGFVLAQIFIYRETPAYLLWLGIMLWMRDRHPPVPEVHGKLGRARTIVAVLLVLIFLLCFIPLPMRLLG